MWINAWLLGWRLLMRAGFTTAAYGWREGLRSIPRTLVANIIAILAARRALLLHSAGGAKPLGQDPSHFPRGDAPAMSAFDPLSRFRRSSPGRASAPSASASFPARRRWRSTPQRQRHAIRRLRRQPTRRSRRHCHRCRAGRACRRRYPAYAPYAQPMAAIRPITHPVAFPMSRSRWRPRRSSPPPDHLRRHERAADPREPRLCDGAGLAARATRHRPLAHGRAAPARQSTPSFDQARLPRRWPRVRPAVAQQLGD